MLSCPRISSLMSATREGHRGNVHKRIVAALLSHRGFYWFTKKDTLLTFIWKSTEKNSTSVAIIVQNSSSLTEAFWDTWRRTPQKSYLVPAVERSFPMKANWKLTWKIRKWKGEKSTNADTASGVLQAGKISKFTCWTYTKRSDIFVTNVVHPTV